MRKTKNNNFQTTEVAFLVVIACVLSFVMAALIFKNNENKVLSINDKNLKNLIDEYYDIIDNYYENVDREKLINSAIEGMINSLDDPYASYYDETAAKNFNIKLDGSYEGVGIEIVKLGDNKTYVLNVFEGSNADKQGLKEGDIIISVDNVDMETISTEDFASMVSDKGKVHVVVQRENETLEMDLVKSLVNIKSVHSQMITQNNRKIGYISVDIFALNTYEQFRDELINLENNNIDSLIIDLKGNTGGHLTSVENILSLFLNRNKIIYQIKKHDEVEKVYSNGNQDKKYKIVILVNEESASGSELVTAALREQLGATIIGKTTYGKGTAQDIKKLPSGEQYKFTTKEWLTPKGNSINSIGITPDIDSEDDDSLEKAIDLLK